MKLLENFEFDVSINKIEILFKHFFNNTMISLILFVLSVIYVFCTEKNKKIRDLFFWYILVILIIIWNPLVIHILGKFINFSSLYRVYYMVPMYPVIAYCFTKIILKFNKKWKKIFGVLLICVIVVLFGKNVFNDWELLEYNNFYKLPDETLFSAEIIYNDKKYQDKKAIVPYGMSSQIQQIYPSIELLYTRIITNNKDENGIPSPADTDNPENNKMIKRINNGDTKYIAELCEKENINYVVFYDITLLQQPLEELGFDKIGSDFGVTVYRRK